MRLILQNAYIDRVRQHRTLYNLCYKMFSLEEDLIFWCDDLHDAIEKKREEFEREMESLEEELKFMREEYKFTAEEMSEIKKTLRQHAEKNRGAF